MILLGYQVVAPHGHALPIYGNPTSTDALFVARSSNSDLHDGEVVAFEDYEPGSYVKLDPGQQREVREGDPWNDIFLWSGEVFVGTVANVWAALSTLKKEIERSAPISLFDACPAELVEERARIARLALRYIESHYSASLAMRWRDHISLPALARGLAQKSLGGREGLGASTTAIVGRDLHVSYHLTDGRELPDLHKIRAALQHVARAVVHRKSKVEIKLTCERQKAENDEDLTAANTLWEEVSRLTSPQEDSNFLLVRKSLLQRRAAYIRGNMSARPLFRMAACPHPEVLSELLTEIGTVSVQSASEAALVHRLSPRAQIAFMNPVKSRADIAKAYRDFGVRIFEFDDLHELEKIVQATEGARDLSLILRLNLSQGVRKFGANVGEMWRFRHVPVTHGIQRFGVSFAVNSLEVTPRRLKADLKEAISIVSALWPQNPIVAIVGGLPGLYAAGQAPPIDEFLRVINQDAPSTRASGIADLWCEVASETVAEPISFVCRVLGVSKGAVTVSDSIYGSFRYLYDNNLVAPTRLIRPASRDLPHLVEYEVLGCLEGHADRLPGRYALPVDIAEGDLIEFGMMGAYSYAMRSRRSGLPDPIYVEARSAPPPPTPILPTLERRNEMRPSYGRRSRRRRKRYRRS